jgi:hypothetical protein
MHALPDHHAGAGPRGRIPARWRAAAAGTAVVAAAALSLTVGTAPASAAGGYNVSVISPAGPVSGPIVSGYRAALCVADRGDSAANDTPITIATCNASPSQDWTITGTGTLQINGKCLDIYRDKKTNKALVELWTCTGGANQQWNPTNGTLVNPVSRKCLDDPRFRTTPGTQLQLYTCNGGANQQWQLP